MSMSWERTGYKVAIDSPGTRPGTKPGPRRAPSQPAL